MCTTVRKTKCDKTRRRRSSTASAECVKSFVHVHLRRVDTLRVCADKSETTGLHHGDSSNTHSPSTVTEEKRETINRRERLEIYRRTIATAIVNHSCKND